MKVLVVGASGLVGSALMNEMLAAGHDARGTCHARRAPGLIPFDALIDNLAELGDFDWVVPLAAQIDPEWVRRNPGASRALNVEAVLRLARQARAVLFVSSEAVFDGTRGGYGETDAPHPLTLYARQKVEVEQALGPTACIVRTGWTVDPKTAHDRCPIAATYDALLKGSARMARDNLFTLTDVRDTARALRLLMEHDARGIHHAAAEPPVIRSTLAGWIAEDSRQGARMSYDEVDFAALSFAEPRPAKAWISSAAARARFGLTFRRPREVVAEKVALLDSFAEQPRRAAL
jgi:dTDP-4-dehydrorhamnose reductase